MTVPPQGVYVCETSFHVRYVETDAMGIVHHSNYLAYFEEGRSSYSRQRGHDYAEFERSGYYLTVTEVSVRYLKPAVYAQKISVLTWIAELKSRGLTFAYEVVDTETRELLVSGMTKHICITRAGRVTTLPDAWRQWAAP
jgi:acyl-CoA thioester hydrolase